MLNNVGKQSELLLEQIQKYPTLEDWWYNSIVWPVFKMAIPQCIALFLLESVILYVHNWLAALFCAVLIILKIYGVMLTISINLMYGFMAMQIRESYNKGVEDGKATS